MAWLLFGPGESLYAGNDPVLLARAVGAALAASSSAAKNCCPLAYLSAGFFANAFNTTLEISSGTRGCAICIGCGVTSVIARSTSPRCGPLNGLRAV